MHNCNPTTWEAEAGRSWVWSQAGLHIENLSQNNKSEFDQTTSYTYHKYHNETLL
jgi:hypothetical protein